MNRNIIVQKERKNTIEEIASSTTKLIIVALVLLILNIIIFIALLANQERAYIQTVLHRNIEIIFCTVSFVLGIFLEIYYMFFVRSQLKKLAILGEKDIYISQKTIKNIYIRIAISMPIKSFIYISLLTIMGYEVVRLVKFQADYIFVFCLLAIIVGIVGFVIFIIQIAGVKNMRGTFDIYQESVKSYDPNFMIPFF